VERMYEFENGEEDCLVGEDEGNGTRLAGEEEAIDRLGVDRISWF